MAEESLRLFSAATAVIVLLFFCRLTDASLVLYLSAPETNSSCYYDGTPSSSYVLVQYRMMAEEMTDVEGQQEWRSVGRINFSSCDVGERRFFTSCTLNLSSYTQEETRGQVRLLQQNHGGEGCDCWRVNGLIASATIEWNTDRFQDNLCDVQGQNEPKFFCGPQNVSRGFVTQVLGISYHCPSGSNLSANHSMSSGSDESDSRSITRCVYLLAIANENNLSASTCFL